jgi:hypothetical protein
VTTPGPTAGEPGNVRFDGPLSDLIPKTLMLPAADSDVVIVLTVVVDDGVVTIPGLRDVRDVLGSRSVDLARTYCGLWMRWLARNANVSAAAS